MEGCDEYGVDVYFDYLSGLYSRPNGILVSFQQLFTKKVSAHGTPIFPVKCIYIERETDATTFHRYNDAPRGNNDCIIAVHQGE